MNKDEVGDAFSRPYPQESGKQWSRRFGAEDQRPLLGERVPQCAHWGGCGALRLRIGAYIDADYPHIRQPSAATIANVRLPPAIVYSIRFATPQGEGFWGALHSE